MTARMRAHTDALLALFLFTIVFLPAALATENSAPRKAHVLLVGTHHFANPNQDYVETHLDDHLSERRQQEIAEVALRLAAFRPTKIALEAIEGVSKVPEHYLAYVNGAYALSADERDQLGLRLAKRLGHARVYAIDSRQDLDLDAVFAAARASENRAFLASFDSAVSRFRALEERTRSLTVGEALALHNSPDEIGRGHAFYLAMAGVSSAPGKFEGADVLSAWLQRNFRIVANLERIVEPDDRILVLYGAGHLGALVEAIAASPKLALVSAGEVLAD